MALTTTSTVAQALRLGLHASEHSRVMRALLEAGENEWGQHEDVHAIYCSRLARRIGRCCAHPVLYRNPDRPALAVGWGKCNSRICPSCRKARQAELARSLEKALGGLDAPKFLTLTLRSSDEPLADQIAHLKASFRRLRQQGLWKSCCAGGVYLIEVTWNSHRNQWHPHIHAIIDSKYIPHRELSGHWKQASGLSSVVDIRMIASKRALASYLSSYVTKGSSLEKIPARKIAEFAHSVAGSRLVHTFGLLHGKPMKEKRDNSGVNKYIAHLAPLYAEARKGDDRANRLWRCLKRLAVGEHTERRIDRYCARVRMWTERYQTPLVNEPPPRPPGRARSPITPAQMKLFIMEAHVHTVH